MQIQDTLKHRKSISISDCHYYRCNSIMTAKLLSLGLIFMTLSLFIGIIGLAAHGQTQNNETTPCTGSTSVAKCNHKNSRLRYYSSMSCHTIVLASTDSQIWKCESIQLTHYWNMLPILLLQSNYLLCHPSTLLPWKIFYRLLRL